MNPADLLKLFGTEEPSMISFGLLFLASVIIDPRQPGADVHNADRAVRASVDALVVSNHGGRQLDGAAPSVVMLPTVVETVHARASQRYVHGDPPSPRVRGG